MLDCIKKIRRLTSKYARIRPPLPLTSRDYSVNTRIYTAVLAHKRMGKNPGTLTEWGKEKQREIFDFWKEEFWNDHYRYNLGAKVFCSPVISDPKFIFSGYNPGNDHEKNSLHPSMEKYFEGDFRLPEDHEYLSDETYDFGVEMREKLLDGRIDIIKNSVAINRYFFRSNGVPEFRNWKRDLPNDKRVTVESFLRTKNRDIIEELAPDYVICAGTASTFDSYQNTWEFDVDDDKTVKTDRRLFVISERSDPTFIGFPHPTGRASASDEEYERIRKALFEEIE